MCQHCWRIQKPIYKEVANLSPYREKVGKKKITPSIQLAYRDKRNFIKGKYNCYCFKQVKLEAAGRKEALVGGRGSQASRKWPGRIQRPDG